MLRGGNIRGDNYGDRFVLPHGNNAPRDSSVASSILLPTSFASATAPQCGKRVDWLTFEVLAGIGDDLLGPKFADEPQEFLGPVVAFRLVPLAVACKWLEQPMDQLTPSALDLATSSNKTRR